MTDNPDFERRLSEQAVRVFAEEWVLAITPLVDALHVGSHMRVNTRRAFLHATRELRATQDYRISFMQILRALGNRIAISRQDLHEPLCEIFTYFMQGHPNPAAYAGFDFYRWVARRSAG